MDGWNDLTYEQKIALTPEQFEEFLKTCDDYKRNSGKIEALRSFWRMCKEKSHASL